MPQASVQDLIRQEATRQGVPPELALAVAEQESSFNPTAVNPQAVGGEHATGTFQLLPSTAKGLGVDAADPLQNIQGGVKYLRTLLDQHQGDLSKVLATYGGVKTDQTYVPGVMARLAKFKAAAAPPTTPPPAPSTAQTTYGRIRSVAGDVLASLDPRTRGGRQNLAGMGGAIAAGAVTGGMGAIPAGLTMIGGAGLAGALEEGGEQLAHGESLDPAAAAGAGATQAAYETAGQVISWPLKAMGRRLVASRVGRYASESLSSARAAMEDQLGKALDAAHTAVQSAKASTEAARARFSMTAPAVSPSKAGSMVEDVIQGPATTALKKVGESVNQAAKSGPDVDMRPVKEKLASIAEQLNPAVSHTPELRTASGDVLPAAQAQKLLAAHPDLATLEPNHPLPSLLDQIRDLPDTIPFEDAHKAKRLLDDAVNWDSPAKKQVQQATKGVRQTLRQQMAGHAPYDEATAAYEQAVQLHRRGIAPKLHKIARENPEAIVKLIKGDEPTKIGMLKDLLLQEAPKGGGEAEGQAAWDAVRAAWTHDRLIKGGVDGLADRIGKLDPEFVQTMYGDQAGQTILSNLQQIGSAFQQALDREKQTGVALKTAKQAVQAGKRLTSDERAFKASSLYGHEQTARSTASNIAHIALYPHSAFTGVRLSELLLKGPRINDLVEWASRSPFWTRRLVDAATSPYAGQAVADLLRTYFGEQETGGAVPSHESQPETPTTPPPAPTSTSASMPPPRPQSSEISLTISNRPR